MDQGRGLEHYVVVRQSVGPSGELGEVSRRILMLVRIRVEDGIQRRGID
jgi:hypothetical protein